MRAALSKPLVYFLLITASGVFLTPFVWLVSSSLKPIEQTMTMPPRLIPRGYYAPIGGERREVTIDYTIKVAGFVADVETAPGTRSRVFLTPEQAKLRASEIRNIHPVEADWVHVTERRDAGASRNATPQWDILPARQVETKIQPRWSNYPKALAALGGNPGESGGNHGVSFWVFLTNTLTVCLLGVLGTVLSNAIVAYGFARLKWRGRDTFFALTLATLMVPFPVLMVPLYGVFRDLHWVGTLLPLWVPAFFGSAFNIFLMRQFFLTIPEELSEAARIDGSSEWRIFWRIILPLSKPVLAVSAVFHFLYAWNDFLGPFLYLTRKETFTLSLALQGYSSQVGGTQWHYLMAASTVTIVPVVVLFFFAQKTFVQGVATTGSKG